VSSVLRRKSGLTVVYRADADLQHRWRLHRRILPHVNVDTILMGHHQRAGSDLVFLCDSGRLVKDWSGGDGL
jgi:hypothetical protein